MRQRILLIIFLAPVFFFFSIPSPILAAKKRVWTSTPAVVTTATGAPSVTARITGWKQYLNLSFWNVSSTNGLSYELTFNGNNVVQGIFGSLKSDDGNTLRSLFLGTCSHGACTSYKNIGNLHLTVTYNLKTGQTLVKKYKVKY